MPWLSPIEPQLSLHRENLSALSCFAQKQLNNMSTDGPRGLWRPREQQATSVVSLVGTEGTPGKHWGGYGPYWAWGPRESPVKSLHWVQRTGEAGWGAEGAGGYTEIHLDFTPSQRAQAGDSPAENYVTKFRP